MRSLCDELLRITAGPSISAASISEAAMLTSAEAEAEAEAEVAAAIKDQA